MFYIFKRIKILLCIIVCFAALTTIHSEELSKKEVFVAREKMISYSKTFLGIPYKYAGASKQGMDCSGFIFTVVNDSLGIKLPRSSGQMYNFVTKIPDNERQQGDLLFFKSSSGSIFHAGIYLESNTFIHSASDGPKTGVIISNLDENFWKKSYAGAGRFLPSL